MSGPSLLRRFAERLGAGLPLDGAPLARLQGLYEAQRLGHPASQLAGLHVHFFLATALRRKNYDRAALDQYAKLIGRLDVPSMSSHTNPELLGLLNQPEMLYGQIGELYE